MIVPDEKLCLNDQFIKENMMLHFKMLDLELVGDEYLRTFSMSSLESILIEDNLIE